eukprot:7953047-Pyramimonas_sp.AAC.1
MGPHGARLPSLGWHTLAMRRCRHFDVLCNTLRSRDATAAEVALTLVMLGCVLVLMVDRVLIGLAGLDVTGIEGGADAGDDRFFAHPNGGPGASRAPLRHAPPTRQQRRGQRLRPRLRPSARGVPRTQARARHGHCMVDRQDLIKPLVPR